MKAAYLITGSGTNFYCSNCHRDRLYVESLKKAGVDIEGVPLYLPPTGVEYGEEFENPVFFGAVSMYLRDRVKMFEHMPSFMDRILDSPPLLKFASKKASSTRVEGFEETTLNMIRGDDPNKQKEINRLSEYLSKGRKPDVIHLANALIMGLASQLKSALGAKIICSLQNEDDWIEGMAEPWKSQAWELIGKESVNIDAFISPSQYFKDLVVEKTGIHPGKISVIPSGLEKTDLENIEHNNTMKAIGFYSRLSEMNGLDKIIDAFIKVSRSGKVPGLELHLCGGYTADDKPFLKKQLHKIHEMKLDDRIKVYHGFSGDQRREFFSAVDIMSVPVNKHDAFGLYLLTANSAGVPVVQPATGAYPEIVGATGGGIIYEPDSVDKLTETIIELYEKPERISSLGKKGRLGVGERFSLEKMAERIKAVYESRV
ncbi:MAG: glycosyltransferase family 4 protein [Marinilabiliaceae bacterium]|jgi:glycosyltransferase involved in cell wall biosynthesis|nr:glycosyltransferase family 4 protein [Marinilabiliaceae bacterium]